MLKIALESLGCSKNLVDAEIMMGILNNKGYKLIGDFEEADVIIVNTCGFIESAKQEFKVVDSNRVSSPKIF